MVVVVTEQLVTDSRSRLRLMVPGQLVVAFRGSANAFGSSSTLLWRAAEVSANAGRCTQMLKITGALRVEKGSIEY